MDRHRIGSRRRDSGLALVLVMTVVLALAIIATPFVLSMILQERTGTISRYASQADYGTQGVRNFAVWRMMYGVDHMERRFGAGALATWHYDTPDELDVRLDDAALTKANILDPKGAIWGLDVQDEQGKIDVRTAPDQVIRLIRQMVDDRIADRKDFLTMYAGRDMAWIYPQRIRALDGQGNAVCRPVGTSGVGTENVYFFGQNSRVRATKPGQPPFEAVVRSNGLTGSFGRAFQTDPPIPGIYLDGVIEVEARHPVNINTAKVETLTAVFTGLNLWNVPDSTVDRGAANQVAQMFAGRRTERPEDFIQKLASANLTGTQRLAIAINAVAPSFFWLNGSGTLPLCFKSYDRYTFDAFASQNNPAGSTMASRGFREVVDVSPPEILTRFCESQYDMDLMLNGRLSIQDARMAGYPYGNRMVSFPFLMPLPPLPQTYSQPPAIADIRLKPQQQPGAPLGEAFVQLSTGIDYRGQGQYDRFLPGWQNQRPREHFNDTQEGKRLNGQAHTYPWNNVFMENQTPQQANQGSSPNLRPDVTTGGMEMWFRFDGVSNPDQIFDIREQDYTNRIGLRVENGELIMQISDSTIGVQGNPIDDGAAQIRMPFSPQQGVWYHFGAYWKGTGLGQMGLLVDGFSHPQSKFEYMTPEGNPIYSELASALTQGSTSFALKNDSWIPTGQIVALQIGAEVMLYDKSAGTLIRGARRTQDANHPAGAIVRPFGYSSRFVQGTIPWQNTSVVCTYDRLTTGGGQIAQDFGMNPQSRSNGDQQDPMTMQWFIDATATDIPVTQFPPSTIMDYPKEGYIRIENEIIYYTDRTTGGVNGQGDAKFTGCVRGQHNTAAVQHNAGRPVLMWAIPTTDYTNYLSPTILLVGDEFIGPVEKDPVRQGFWIPPVYANGGGLLNLRRGTYGTIPQAHTMVDRVSPTFLVSDTDGLNRLNMGGDDWITLTDASNLKEQAQVRNTAPPFPNYNWGNLQPQVQGGGGGGVQLAALYGPTGREYVVDLANPNQTRALKFPSGELLGLNFVKTVNPQFSIGPVNATIDELKFFVDPRRFHIVAQEMSTSDNTVNAAGQGGGYGQMGGLVKIGNEYIGYQAATNSQLTNVKRGWLSSTAEVHDAGDPLFSLHFVPVSTLQNDITQTDRILYLNQELSGRVNEYRQGYVLIDNEILRFEWNGQQGTELTMPARWDGTTGLYRGMFGTQPAAHTANTALVYGIPWRFNDTYKQREFDNTMAYFQWSTRMEEAKWHQIKTMVEMPQGDSNIALHTFVRIDGKGEFWDPPGMSDQTLLLEFLNGAGGNINRKGYLNDAGQLDVRFYVEYKQGSFDAMQPWAVHTWKRSPKIKEIQVDYDRPTRTLYHEDK